MRLIPNLSQKGEEDRENFQNLAAIAWDAVTGIPPLYPFSFFGWPSTWFAADARFSEFRIISPWRLGRTIKFLWNIGVPAIPLNPPVYGPPQVNALFWQPSVILQRPDHNGSYTSFPQEAWFAVNGIMTNDAVAQINSAYLAYLFHRPMTMIWNSTDSMPVDLLECALGKEWYWNVEPAVVAFPPLFDALKDPGKKRVVVIAHSQGTIIMANILRLLKGLYAGPRPPAEERGLLSEIMPIGYAPPEFVYPDHTPVNLADFEPIYDDELEKLEVYLFANCATTMAHLRAPAPGKPPLPWLESFGNENDVVARLGMLAPRASQRGIELAGPLYQHDKAWGHLLGAHYLLPIEKVQKRGRKRGGAGTAGPFVLLNPTTPHYRWPRLFDYINGGTPHPDNTLVQSASALTPSVSAVGNGYQPPVPAESID